MITVSLNELGTEGYHPVDEDCHLDRRITGMVPKKALLSIGSAINELTASSAAAASGPIGL